MEAPRSYVFDVKRDANELDNYLRHMGCCFEAMMFIDEQIKLWTATLIYLILLFYGGVEGIEM